MTANTQNSCNIIIYNIVILLIINKYPLFYYLVKFV